MNHLKLILTHCPLFVSGSPCSLGAYYWSCNSRHMVLWDQNSQTGRDKGRGHRGGEDKSEFLSHQTQRAKKRKEWEIKMQIESCVRDRKHRLGREHKIKGNNLPWGRRQSYAAYAPKHSLLNAWKAEMKKSSQQSSSQQRWGRARKSHLQQIQFTS